MGESAQANINVAADMVNQTMLVVMGGWRMIRINVGNSIREN